MGKYLGIKKIKYILFSSENISAVKNHRGQFAVETILITTILVGGFLLFTKTLKEKQIVQHLFQKPMINLKTMAGYGTWKESCKGLGSTSSMQRLANCHPNSISRALSSNPN